MNKIIVLTNCTRVIGIKWNRGRLKVLILLEVHVGVSENKKGSQSAAS